MADNSSTVVGTNPQSAGETSVTNSDSGGALQSLEQSYGTTQKYQWPSTYNAESGLWMLFDQLDYTIDNIEGEGTLAKSAGSYTLCLPVPANLSANYTVNWQNEDEGIAGHQIVMAEANGFKQIKGAVKNGVNLSVEDLKKAFGSTTIGNVVKGVSQWAFNNFLDAGTNTETVQQAGSVIGIARNPYQAVVFQSPNFRTFQFSWKMIAKNKDEADQIRNIIKTFKIGGAPSYNTGLQLGTNLFSYPNLWQFSFSDPSYLFKTTRCILQSVDVNYHGENTPAYFNAANKIPYSIILSVQFQEVQIMTKEYFQQGY